MISQKDLIFVTVTAVVLVKVRSPQLAVLIVSSLRTENLLKQQGGGCGEYNARL